MRSVRRRWSIVSGAIVGVVRARRWWRRRPTNVFTSSGYEVIEGFLEPAECARLVALADEHLCEPSHVVKGDCYTWVKSESAHGRNASVRELLNVEVIDPMLGELARRRSIQELFESRLGEPVELIGFGIQVDGVDTRTKRDFHIDRHFPPLFKAFVYLTDVEDDGDGPFTIVPGSHRQFRRRVLNDVVNALTSGARRDMHRFIDRERARRVLGPAGTLTLATQDATHKGWGNHWRRDRYALIAYCTTGAFFDGRPLREGRNFLAVT